MKKMLASVATIVMTTIGLSQGNASAIFWEYVDINGDNTYDVLLLDRWHDGLEDVQAFDVNNNGTFDFVTVDYNNDNWLEVALYDVNQNGIFDAYAWDADLLQGWENMVLDLNENGYPDNLEATTVFTPIVQTPVDFSSPSALPGYIATGGDFIGPYLEVGDDDGNGIPNNSDYHPGDPDCNQSTDRGCFDQY